MIGTFEFTPEIRSQPLNRLIEDLGIYGTGHIPAGIPLSPLAFCTGNLSLPTAEALTAGGFDESFSEPAGEDLDLGYRLGRQRGVPLIFTRQARAWHDHPHSFATWRDRWRMWGRAYRRLAEKHCDPCFWPGGAASMDPRNGQAARARLVAQEPLAFELAGWLERLSQDPSLAFEARVEGLGRTFRLPDEAETLMKAGLALTPYFVQRAFWDA